MARLREELNFLDSSVMSSPCVEPLLWDEAVVFLVSQVARRLHKTLSCLVEDAAIAMVNRSWLEEGILARIFCLCLGQSGLSFLFVGLHDGLLLLCQDSTLLPFELFHAFVGGPRSLEITLASLPECLPLGLHLTFYLLLRLLGHGLGFVSDLSHVEAGGDPGSISRVHRDPCVIEPNSLIVES